MIRTSGFIFFRVSELLCEQVYLGTPNSFGTIILHQCFMGLLALVELIDFTTRNSCVFRHPVTHLLCCPILLQGPQERIMFRLLVYDAFLNVKTMNLLLSKLLPSGHHE